MGTKPENRGWGGGTGHKAGHRRDGTKAGLGEGLENPGQSRQRPDGVSEVKDEVR